MSVSKSDLVVSEASNRTSLKGSPGINRNSTPTLPQDRAESINYTVNCGQRQVRFLARDAGNHDQPVVQFFSLPVPVTFDDTISELKNEPVNFYSVVRSVPTEKTEWDVRRRSSPRVEMACIFTWLGSRPFWPPTLLYPLYPVRLIYMKSLIYPEHLPCV